MIISEIKDIERKETYIYYQQQFSAVAVFSIFGGETNVKIEFSIEHKPTGETDIKVKILDNIDYPILKPSMELKTSIRSLLEQDLLP